MEWTVRPLFKSTEAEPRQIRRNASKIRASPSSPRSRQTCHQTAPKRIHRHCEDDRDDRRNLLCSGDCTSHRDDDVYLEPDELGRNLGVAVAPSLCPAIR
jgi:hypothetical protein